MTRQSKKAAANTRAERVAQLQKEAKSSERRRASGLWVGLGLVLVLIVGLVGGAILYQINNRPDLGATVVYDDPADPEDDLSRDHVPGAVEYEQTPPVGGEHNATWLNCGIYDEPVPNEHAVHDLEHGAIWITYQPDLPQDQIDKLKEIADENYILLSPYEGIDSPIYVTAWGLQLAVDTADDNRIPAFITEWKQGPQTPEPGAACTMGTDVDLVPRG